MRIDRKITAWTIGIVLLLSLVSAYVNLQFHVREESRSFEDLGRTLGPIVEQSIEDSMITRNTALAERTLSNLSAVEPIKRIWLLNTRGEVRLSTDKESIGTRFSREDQQCDACHRAGLHGVYLPSAGVFRWVQPLRNKPECFRCHPQRQKHDGFAIIDFSVDQSRGIMKGEIRDELVGFLPALAVVGLGMLLLIRQLVIRRVNAISDGLKQFTAGESGVRIPVQGQDELARLGEGFNTMAETISQSQRELRQHADELLSLAVSSNVVTAIPRTENIFDAVCNIAVKELGMKMAWIGVLREGEPAVDPVAECGFNAGYLATVRVTSDDSPTGRGPTGMTIKTKIPHIMNDAEQDPGFVPWREDALKRGYRSSMALPLLSTDGDVMGVLNLYSGEAGYFTRKRVRIFIIFGNQVAAAIENRTLIEHVELRSAEIVEQMKTISRSQKEWQLTFDSITDLISIHDREFRVIKANRSFLTFFGLDADDRQSRKCYEVFHGTCGPIDGCPHQRSMRESCVVSQEIVDPKRNRAFLVSVFPYYNAEGEFLGSVHIARDITEIKEKETRLIMSERLAGLGQMASGIAHEINNPLASIAGCAEGLLAKVKKDRYDPALFEDYLKIIQEEVQRCKSITTGMLSFVRKTSYEKKAVAVNAVLDKTIEVIGFQGRLRNVHVVRSYADLPDLWGSEGELRQVFLAVVSNSLDAMGEAGTLMLGTRQEGESILVTIEDTGPGIPHEYQQRIFDPFFTTKSDSGGTGLGLSIAYKIVTNHNGSIAVASETGKGALFTILLPLTVSP